MTAPQPVNRSTEELAMRELVVTELRRRYPRARIIHELPLRYSERRIDLAAVTETEIVSVEIKSSADMLDRLEAQLRAFVPISSRLIVGLAPKWNEKLPDKETHSSIRGLKVTSITRQRTEAQELINRLWAGHVEIWTVDANAGSIEVTAGGGDWSRPNRRLWLAQMLDMLHVSELVDIAARHRICVPKRPRHDDLVTSCAELMAGREIVAAVCRALRARAAFAAGTDAPMNQVQPT